jgi:hypothetical protein
MNKKIIYSVIFLSLFCLVSFALADSVSITNPLSGVNNFNDLLTKIATAVGELIATLGTIMLIVSGILYLTSAGSPEKIGAAKKALIYAIAGIVIGLAATAIVAAIKQIMGASS